MLTSQHWGDILHRAHRQKEVLEYKSRVLSNERSEWPLWPKLPHMQERKKHVDVQFLRNWITDYWAGLVLLFSSTLFPLEGIKATIKTQGKALSPKRFWRTQPSASETLMWNELHVSIVWLRYAWNSTNCFATGSRDRIHIQHTAFVQHPDWEGPGWITPHISSQETPSPQKPVRPRQDKHVVEKEKPGMPKKYTQRGTRTAPCGHHPVVSYVFPKQWLSVNNLRR